MLEGLRIARGDLALIRLKSSIFGERVPMNNFRRKVRFVYMSLAAASLLASSPALAADPAAKAGGGFDKEMDEYLSKDDNVKKVGDALERYFRKKQAEQAKEAQEADANRLENQFKNPVKVDLGDAPVRGPADAKVTIVTFSDFQCPFCQRGAATMDEVLKAYPKEVKLVFKNLPLPFHDKAKPAARAALAAKKQGKFWEMHDLLFKNQQSFSDEGFAKFATDLGLDVEKFKADMASPDLDKAIDADAEQGRQLGVNGTPGFFVNGVLISGAQPLPAFKSVIDRWLKQGA